MKQESFNRGFKKIFKWSRYGSVPTLLKYELGLYKKLRNFFLIGDFYYFIINHHSLTLEFASKQVEEALGYHPSELDILFIKGKLHPDNCSQFLAKGTSVIDFFSQLAVEKLMKYKVRYDIRFRNKMVNMHGFFIREYCLNMMRMVNS